MPCPPLHQRLAAHPHRVPAPFASFAVRSDEALHAWQARAPYGWVHRVQTRFLDTTTLARLAADGLARVDIAHAGDVDYAPTTWAHLSHLAWLACPAPQAPELAEQLAQALRLTAVLGTTLAPYQQAVASRLDYLAARGAGFHNDVSGPWSRSLFWLLALGLADVEFVMPHAGVRLPLAPGDLLVFDQTLAHGLCRPQDQGQMRASSFETGADARQIFMTGELRLDDAQWAALDAPWLPIAQHAQQRALDLLVAEFDECSGHIKRLRALRDGMRHDICHVDGLAPPGSPAPPSPQTPGFS